MSPWIKSWDKKQPGWSHTFWTDNGAAQFVKNEHPKLLPMYKNYPEDVQRVDVLKYMLMSSVGGVYADIDVECVKKLDQVIT